MKPILTFWYCIALAALPGRMARAQTQAPGQSPPVSRIMIDFYFEDGCSECEQVRQEVLPALEGACSGTYTLREYSTGVLSNYLALVELMERHKVARNERVFMLVNRQVLLAGFREIADRLIPVVTEQLIVNLDGIAPPPPDHAAAERDAHSMLSKRVRSFTVMGVAVAGLADGINPCAIATLVFLVSVLAMARTRGAHIARIGAAFCIASFLTYTAIGFGLMHALHALKAFHAVKQGIETATLLVLLLLAFLSFRDAARFRTSRRSSDITLQLPGRIKSFIHRLLRRHIGQKTQVATAFAIGSAVTALESVCTGQVYVPTLVLVTRSGANVSQGVSLLLLYNLMFISPLIITLLLVWRGMKVEQLIAWSGRNVAASKMLLGLLFLILAVLFLALR